MRDACTMTIASLLVLSSLLLTAPAIAAPFDGQPKILLHRTNALSKNPCSPAGLTDCTQAVTSGDLNTPGYVYVLVAKGNLTNLLAVSFAVEYQDNCPDDVMDGRRIDIFGWNSCADVQLVSSVPAWPAPRSGMYLDWNGSSGCQTGPLTIGGYFYMSAYQADTLHVTPNHPNAGFVTSIANCDREFTYLAQSELGSVGFSSGSSAPGCNPCDGPCADPLPAPGPVNCQAPPPPPPPPPPATHGPKLLLHVGDVVTKNRCASGRLDRCDQAVTAGGLSTPAGPFYYLYLLGARGTVEDLAAILVGIDYETGAVSDMSNGTGVDVFSWSFCGTLEFIRGSTNTWPSPGGSNLMVWDRFNTCQAGELAVAGFFYVGAYSADRFRLINDSLVNKAQVVTCDPIVEIDLSPGDLGYVEFSDGNKARGCNPCLVNCTGAVTVTPTTWSRLKTLIGQ